MAIQGIDDFKAKLAGGGARSNLFKVTCTFPGYAGGDQEFTSFMCRAAALPPDDVGTITVPYRGRNLKLPGDRAFDTNWDITIYNDADMAIRKSFETWMNGMAQHVNNIGLTNPADYQTDMRVEQLSRDSQSVVHQYDIRGAFPVSLSQIDLNYDANDAIAEFTV